MALLWIRLATNGHGHERYSVQIPFQFGPSHSMRALEKPQSISVNGLIIELRETEGIFFLRLIGFTNRTDAANFLPKALGALLHTTIARRLGLRAAAQTQEPVFFESPIDARNNPNFGNLIEEAAWTHVDGHVEPTRAVILPEHQRILEMGAGGAQIRIDLNPMNLLTEIGQALQMPVERIAADRRLSLATDLFAAALSEQRVRNRIVTLTAALEALLETTVVSPVALEQLDSIVRFCDDRLSALEEETKRSEMARLKARIESMRTESISRQLQLMTANHSNAFGTTSKSAGKQMSAVYDVRSRLVHGEKVEEGEASDAAAWLLNAVPIILEERMKSLCH